MSNEKELVYQVKEKNLDFDYILEKYKPLIIKYSKKYSYLKKCGLDFEDIYQILSLALYESINKYNFDNNLSFSSFYYYVVKHKISNELRRINTQKFVINKNTVSLDNDNNHLLELIPSSCNDFDYIYEKDLYEKLNEIKKDLTFNEVCIIDLYLEGFKVKEIESLIDEESQTIRRTISKIKGLDFTQSCLI